MRATFNGAVLVAGVNPSFVQETKPLGGGVLCHISHSENGLLIEIENSGKGRFHFFRFLVILVEHALFLIAVANPCPIVVTFKECVLDNLEAESSEPKFWILPNVDVKLPTSAGGQVRVFFFFFFCFFFLVFVVCRGLKERKRSSSSRQPAIRVRRLWFLFWLRKQEIALVLGGMCCSWSFFPSLSLFSLLFPPESATVSLIWEPTESAFDFVKIDYGQKKRQAEDIAAKIPSYARLSPPELELALESAGIQNFVDAGQILMQCF
jgi:hypothetical protein